MTWGWQRPEPLVSRRVSRDSGCNGLAAEGRRSWISRRSWHVCLSSATGGGPDCCRPSRPRRAWTALKMRIRVGVACAISIALLGWPRCGNRRDARAGCRPPGRPCSPWPRGAGRSHHSSLASSTNAACPHARRRGSRDTCWACCSAAGSARAARPLSWPRRWRLARRRSAGRRRRSR